MAERRTADAEQTGSTSGQAALPLWVTIGVEDLADASIDSEEGAFIGEYASDEALQSAVVGHPLQDYIVAAIQEVRRGAASTDEAKAGDTSGQAALPLWVTIGVEDLADASIDSEEGAFIGEYASDEALQSAVVGHPLQDYIVAAIQEVRRGAASTETTSPLDDGAKDAS